MPDGGLDLVVRFLPLRRRPALDVMDLLLTAAPAARSWTGHMIDPVQIFWVPAGASMPSLGSRALVDVTDGDTPNLRMPVRMLSVDTPEVTAESSQRASKIDQEFAQLAEWIRHGKAPIDPGLAEFLLPTTNAYGQPGIPMCWSLPRP